MLFGAAIMTNQNVDVWTKRAVSTCVVALMCQAQTYRAKSQQTQKLARDVKVEGQNTQIFPS